MSTIAASIRNRPTSWVFAALSIAVLVVGIVVFSLTRLTGDTATPASGEPAAAQPAAGAPPGGSAEIEGIAASQKIEPAARRVAGEFLLTAVARKNLASSFKLVHPDLKGGLTLEQWKTGEIPVTPFPVETLENARFSVVERHKGGMTLEVVLIPPEDVDMRSAVFQLGLTSIGNGQRWLVDYWMPRWTPPIPANPSG
jgi:hypothetical protein